MSFLISFFLSLVFYITRDLFFVLECVTRWVNIFEHDLHFGAAWILSFLWIFFLSYICFLQIMKTILQWYTVPVHVLSFLFCCRKLIYFITSRDDVRKKYMMPIFKCLSLLGLVSRPCLYITYSNPWN